MRAGDFWDDQSAASKVSAEYSRVKRRLEYFAVLEGRYADLESTAELLREELGGNAVHHEPLQQGLAGTAVPATDLQRGDARHLLRCM